MSRLLAFLSPQLLMEFHNPSIDVKRTFPSNSIGAVKPRSQIPALHDAADSTQKAKQEHFLRVMANFENEQEATANASASAPKPNLSAKTQTLCIYQLPVGLNHISNSLKIDDPPIKIRVGQMSNFVERSDPANGSKYWIGLAWAEIFFPVLGERPASLIGNKAYEVVLKQPIAEGGDIVRENVVTTGRVVGVVVAELLHETVSVRVEDWLVQSETFKKGRWRQHDVAILDHAS